MTLAPCRVLVVDDNEETAELLEVLLGRSGHDVRVAHDVDEALRIAGEFEPQVALLDIMIRCESGYFLARQIRALPHLESCQIVAITGFAQDQLRQASEAAGFQGHLTKPIDDGALFDALEACSSATQKL
ncbi:MAG: response regulator [Polyangiaceae bacterium]